MSGDRMADKQDVLEKLSHIREGEWTPYFDECAKEIKGLRAALEQIKATALTLDDYILGGPATAMLRAQAMARIATEALK